MSDDQIDHSPDTTACELLNEAAALVDVLRSPPIRATIVDVDEVPCKVDVNIAAHASRHEMAAIIDVRGSPPLKATVVDDAAPPCKSYVNIVTPASLQSGIRRRHSLATTAEGEHRQRCRTSV